jgi:hypothetical protein
VPYLADLKPSGRYVMEDLHRVGGTPAVLRLLLAHGMLDSNVPPYNTLLVVEELIKANKDFDLLIFPNQRHGYGEMSSYMTRRRWDYFVRHLLGAEPPKEYRLKPQSPRGARTDPAGGPIR